MASPKSSNKSQIKRPTALQQMAARQKAQRKALAAALKKRREHQKQQIKARRAFDKEWTARIREREKKSRERLREQQKRARLALREAQNLLSRARSALSKKQRKKVKPVRYLSPITIKKRATKIKEEGAKLVPKRTTHKKHVIPKEYAGPVRKEGCLFKSPLNIPASNISDFMDNLHDYLIDLYGSPKLPKGIRLVFSIQSDSRFKVGYSSHTFSNINDMLNFLWGYENVKEAAAKVFGNEQFLIHNIEIWCMTEEQAKHYRTVFLKEVKQTRKENKRRRPKNSQAKRFR